MAQGQTVSGTVVDRLTREPIVGATVIDAATRKGTVSDIDGRFAISPAALPATLRISFIGYKPQEAVVTDAGRELAVSLEEEVNDLTEMVAVGYGTQRRTQLTGSVTKIKADVFASSPSPTLDGALGGAVAGLNVTAASGQPGAASSIRIRGGNSVNASNEPLYVIDGFIYNKDAGAAKTGLGAIESSLNPLSTVNPMDIESVEVLKDISATAIYGSRGANGVILVTTRRGSRDRTVVSYRYTVGLDAAARRLDLMNAREWADYQKTYFYNKGGYTDEQIAALGDGTDWQDAMLQTALRQSHELSVTGGSAKGRYAFSASSAQQDGIIINSGFDRYNATATVRADKSSRFAGSHRWGCFPSLGLSWNADREGFLAGSPTVSQLKARASFGVVGNQEIGDYEYSLSYTAGQYDGASSYTKNNAANDDLKWETTASANLGIDLGLMSNRVQIVADIYHKKTSDLLLEVPVGFASGVSTQLQNVGNVVNRGVELTLTLTLAEKSDFGWTVEANIARNVNEITDMGSTDNVILGDCNQNILRKGQPLGTFYGLRFVGIVQTSDDTSALPTVAGSRPKPGDVLYADTDGNDRVTLGSIQPNFTYGLSTQLRYRRWDAQIAFVGSHGNKVFNSLGRRLEQTGDSYNVLRTVLDSWTPDNPANRLPLASNARQMSYIDSRYVEDASYLKLRNLTVGFTLPALSRIPARLRLFATASNLLTVSSYSGYDPEVASGTDTGAYPSARSVLFGLDLTF